MKPLLVLSEIPTWLAAIGLGVTVIVGCIGVCGALMAQQYIVAANRVRERFKALREAYVNFVTATHNHNSLWKAQFKNQKVPALWMDTANTRLRDLPPSVTPDKKESIRQGVMDTVRQAIATSYSQELALNARLADAADEIHRSYSYLFMLDPSATRREQVKKKYSECITAQNRLHSALTPSEEQAVLAEYATPLLDMEDWLANVSAELNRDEDAELAGASWFRK